MTKTIDEILEDFALFDDWEERYRYIIELGRTLAPLDEHYRAEEYRVQGCTSRVWFHGTEKNGRLVLEGDSDAALVKGLIAILFALYSGRTAQEIAAIDAKAVFEKLQLKEHLSPSRSNGFYAMVGRIRQMAGVS